MYIVFDTDTNFDALRSKYLLLELDTLEITEDEAVTTYCVVDRDHLTLQEIPLVESKIRIHEALIRNYRKGNWEFCEEAIEKLHGSFKGELDSFYDILGQRICLLKTQEISERWSGNIRPSWQAE